MDSHSNATCSTQKHRKMACAERKRKLTNAVYTIRQQRKATNISHFCFVSPRQKREMLHDSYKLLAARQIDPQYLLKRTLLKRKCRAWFGYHLVHLYLCLSTLVRTRLLQLECASKSKLHWLGPEAMHRTVQWPKSQANWQY